MKAILTREESTDQGTPGILVACYMVNGIEYSMSLHTLELPWRENRTGRSCIPKGTYLCQWRKSPSRGWCYHVRNVPARSGILIHSGNWAGDVTKGFKSNVEGCILVGVEKGRLEKQTAVIQSRAACRALASFFKEQDFTLTVTGP